jgi:MFS family permease
VALGFAESALPAFSRFGLVGAALGAVAAGPVVALIGPRRAILAGTALVAAGTLTLLAVNGLLPIGAGLLGISFGSLVVYIGAPAFLAASSSPEERPYLFGVAAAAYVVSTAVGAAAGGALPGMVRALAPDSPAADVYRTSLVVAGLLSAIAIPLLALTREAHDTRETIPGAAPAVASPVRAVRDFIAHARQPGFLKLVAQLVLADGLIRVGGNLFLPYLNVYFVNHLGASEALYGAMRSVERGLVVLTTLSVAVLAARFGPIAVIVLTQLVSVPFLLAVGLAPTLAVAVGAYVIRGPIMEMTQPTRDNFVVDVSPARLRATALAALTLAGYAIGFATSYVSERLFDAGQFRLSFVMAAVLYVVSAVLYWLFFRAYNRARG